jgi:two-component system sensor histidine kinase RegB
VAVVGQSLAIGFVHAWMEMKLPLGPLFAVVGAELLLNLVATYRARTRSHVREGELAVWVGVDLVAFTSLLYFTGGPSNPFIFFYIVHVSMAALTLRPAVAWALVSISAIGFAGLFAKHVPLPSAGQSGNVHLYGVWVAYGLLASCLVYFIHRARGAIQQREIELSEQRELRLQAERLSSLATLAAGAAHELASPLGTIAIVSKELENELKGSGYASAIEDIALVRGQVERCRRILARMAHAAGEAPGETDTWQMLGDLLNLSIAELPERQRIRVALSPETRDSELLCPKEALGQALRVLLDNALDASDGGVSIEARSFDQFLELRVSDEGEGMPPQVLQRAFEPFFTTKPTGKGMGLGLFLARNVVTGMGGSLRLSSEVGQGTHARILLPMGRLRWPPSALAPQ